MKKARVIEAHKTTYIISDGGNELTATVRGSFFTEGAFPKVGDFVMYSQASDNKAVIEEILPRTSTIVRKAVETDLAQVLVANVDLIFIVMGLDNDFNLSRLERYLLLAKQSDVKPVVVLNKTDAFVDYAKQLEEAQKVAGEIPVFAVSAKTGNGMQEMLEKITPETTAVLLGSSGAGKSTITNWLLQTDKQETAEVRGDDSRGRHTTTSRQLFSLPTGGYLIDTPGMRELNLFESTTEDEETVFAQLENLSRECKFANCDHEKSKGCAILDALESEEITERQIKSYQKLKNQRIFEENKGAGGTKQQRQLQKKRQRGYDDAQAKKDFNQGL